MNFIPVIHVLSYTLVILSFFMFSAIPVGHLMGDESAVLWEMTLCAIIPLMTGGMLILLTRKRNTTYGVREGFGIVAFTWFSLGIFGATPYILIEHFHWIDAFFETISGFTTTGATIVDPKMILYNQHTLPNGVESLSYTVLYWRSMTHWMGGMGVVILSVAVLPFLGLGTQNLFKAEITGPTSAQLTPRITSAAKLLWAFYFIMTLILTLLLLSTHMSLFDAWNHACSTIATGGFSTKQASIAAFQSSTVNWIITFFMFFSGINFILHLKVLRGDKFLYWRDEECRWYTIIVMSAILLLSVFIYASNTPFYALTGETFMPDFLGTLEHVAFTVTAIVTTTGFATVDYINWGTFALLILLFLMMTGACGGSTSGGLKQSRMIISIKYAIAQIEYCLFPHARANIRFNQSRIDLSAVYKTLGFFVLYGFTVIVVALLLSMCVALGGNEFDSMSFETAFSMSVATISNVGPAMGTLSAHSNCAFLPDSAKILLAFTMVLGRLEFFTILVLLLPGFWRK